MGVEPKVARVVRGWQPETRGTLPIRVVADPPARRRAPCACAGRRADAFVGPDWARAGRGPAASADPTRHRVAGWVAFLSIPRQHLSMEMNSRQL